MKKILFLLLTIMLLTAIALADGQTCPGCGKPDVASKFCPDCGTPMPARDWSCPVCGLQGLASRFCPDCGTARPATETKITRAYSVDRISLILFDIASNRTLGNDYTVTTPIFNDKYQTAVNIQLWAADKNNIPETDFKLELMGITDPGFHHSATEHVPAKQGVLGFMFRDTEFLKNVPYGRYKAVVSDAQGVVWEQEVELQQPAVPGLYLLDKGFFSYNYTLNTSTPRNDSITMAQANDPDFLLTPRFTLMNVTDAPIYIGGLRIVTKGIGGFETNSSFSANMELAPNSTGYVMQYTDVRNRPYYLTAGEYTTAFWVNGEAMSNTSIQILEPDASPLSGHWKGHSDVLNIDLTIDLFDETAGVYTFLQNGYKEQGAIRLKAEGNSFALIIAEDSGFAFTACNGTYTLYGNTLLLDVTSNLKDGRVYSYSVACEKQ